MFFFFSKVDEEFNYLPQTPSFILTCVLRSENFAGRLGTIYFKPKLHRPSPLINSTF